ncbi:DEAD/DEAH box helicase family protein [Chondrinema litorale]|uniref:DEAD/DEAH box helicase family protein n=1 Tax=Chondrinema litorale TaxID=2994555 RepID=UPI0025432E64|nr:DEAD/DEAH box helicase family protein [Chondrinema litorale]UZR98105.1 DEAD/DEAH box helicase family protein [Chondrinema litorale]
MKEFPANINFKYNWRKYQQRVLQELDEHLKDNHLHIVAPPGSGKTVLGLEVMLRINKPSLVLAPTVAIRNQWIQRFCDLFLQVDRKPDWISRDIKNPKFLTVSTYQGLHAALKNEQKEIDEETKLLENPTQLISVLKEQQIGTIVIDEAHHLKNAWWQSLDEVKRALQPTIVGLTATPPYDVSHQEWQRYITLNGPVDTEISVPELVAEGDLCPHQDYVFLSKPTEIEERKIEKIRRSSIAVFNDIKYDGEFIKILSNHPYFVEPKEHLDAIYSNLEYYSAMLIYLKAGGIEITEEHLELIDNKKVKIPQLTFEWLEILLAYFLFKDAENTKEHEVFQEELIKTLKRAHVLENKTINFSTSEKIDQYLGSSISKLQGINNIVAFEYQNLALDLRMVILTDYIRKEFLVSTPENELELNKIGVVSIFESLRRNNNNNAKLGILSGSLVIIPQSALALFTTISSLFGITVISTSPLAYDGNYLIINATEQIKHDVVNITTQVFQKGGIEVLIGTKSLLGEGWDAPAINSLILASFVGSYVLSNQMRGRAIRTDRNNQNKTGNIWHLVCIDPTAKNGGDDLKLLKRRFKAFVGVNLDEESGIENGINRLNLPQKFEDETREKQLNLFNKSMFQNAAQRELLKAKWSKSIENGVNLVEEIKIPSPPNVQYQRVKSLHYNKTIGYMAGSLGVAAFGFRAIFSFTKGFWFMESADDFWHWAILLGISGSIALGGKSFKTFKTYVKYRDIAKDFQGIGQVVLNTLIKIGVIHTHKSELELFAEVQKDGSVYCHLEGGSNYERSAFINALHEVVSDIENPRYLIVRKSQFLNLISQRDYHAVPEIIHKKKQHVQFFKKQWEFYVGNCEMIYTRNIEGRKLLLKSKVKSLASQFEEKAARINKWR